MKLPIVFVVGLVAGVALEGLFLGLFSGSSKSAPLVTPSDVNLGSREVSCPPVPGCPVCKECPVCPPAQCPAHDAKSSTAVSVRSGQQQYDLVAPSHPACYAVELSATAGPATALLQWIQLPQCKNMYIGAHRMAVHRAPKMRTVDACDNMACCIIECLQDYCCYGVALSPKCDLYAEFPMKTMLLKRVRDENGNQELTGVFLARLRTPFPLGSTPHRLYVPKPVNAYGYSYEDPFEGIHYAHEFVHPYLYRPLRAFVHSNDGTSGRMLVGTVELSLVVDGVAFWSITAPLIAGTAFFEHGGPERFELEWCRDVSKGRAMVDVQHVVRLVDVSPTIVAPFTRNYLLVEPPDKATLSFVNPPTSPVKGVRCNVAALGAGECCLPPLEYRLLKDGKITTDPGHESHQLNLKLVDGEAELRSGFAEPVIRGVARFEHLVVKLTGKKATTLVFKTTGHGIDFNVGGIVQLNVPIDGAFCSDVKPFSASLPTPKDSDPVLVVIMAHECVPCIVQLLENVKRFVPKSVVLLHINLEFTLESKDEEALKAAHPALTLAPRIRTSVYMLGGMFFRLLKYALSADAKLPQWSHALVMASNEMFVKPGAYEYMKQFDMPIMTRPPPKTGILYEVALDTLHGNRHNMPQLVPEELVVERGVWPPVAHFAFDSTFYTQDFKLRKAMYENNISLFSSSFVHAEGTFFSRKVLEKYVMPRFDFSADNLKLCGHQDRYPVIEIHPPTLLADLCNKSDVKCGHRVGTVMWNRLGGEIWTATPGDVRRAACGPSTVPFALKRVPRELDHPTRVEVTKLMAMSDAEIAEFCKTAKW